MKLLLLLLISTNALALDCLPAGPGSGTERISGKTDKGEWSNYWCPVIGPIAGKPYWQQQTFAVLTKYKDVAQVAYATAQALTASSPLVSINAAILQGRIEPAVGTQDRFDWETLLYTACNSLVAANQVPLDPLPAGYCKPPTPVLPPAPTYTHAVKANGVSPDRPAFLLTAGVRGTKEVSRATVGQPCDLTKPTLASGTEVWAQFAPDFVAGRVALCAANPTR